MTLLLFQNVSFPSSLIPLSTTSANFTMAGVVRQPIDVPSLERYITQNVPQIKTPIDLKQVRPAMQFVVQGPELT
jgi:hypothetical protein